MEICIVMEYCQKGDLEQRIERHVKRQKPIKENEIWVYALDILEGLAGLHSRGICHRGK